MKYILFLVVEFDNIVDPLNLECVCVMEIEQKQNILKQVKHFKLKYDKEIIKNQGRLINNL